VDLKRQAATAAADLVESGMILGLGSGSTAALVVREIGVRLKDGRLRDLRGVPTSEATARIAREEGIALLTLEEAPVLDLTLDGADEVDDRWNLIKGAGGSLLREKITAQISRLEAIVVDESKLVRHLGERMPLPVEVVPFGWSTHLGFLKDIGGRPVLRSTPDGRPFITDEGNYTLDVGFGGAAGGTDAGRSDSGRSPLFDPYRLHSILRGRAGVIETGLFLDMTTILVVARPEGVTTLRERPR
jgi:ribose 5-phosphate isomerase A